MEEIIMEEQQQKEITFGRVLKVAFGRWKLLIPVVAAVAAGTFVGIKFGYNTFKGSYTSTFSYSSADLTQEKYADGSALDYRNLISYDNLNKVKALDEKYSSIDIDAIREGNGIKISEDKEKKTYTVTLAYKYVRNTAVAKSFMNDIASSALTKDIDIVNNNSFDSALVLFDETDTFEKQIKYLVRQANFLTSSYDTIASTAGLPISVGEQATANKEKVGLIIDSSFERTMNYRISSNGYVKDYTSAEAKSLSITKDELLNEKSRNTLKIADLENEINTKISTDKITITSLSQQLESLLMRQQDIDYEVEVIDRKIDNEGKTPAGYAEFVADLASYRSKLANATNDYKAVLKSAYIDGAAVNYEDTSVIKLNGTIGTVINIAISLVAGVVVGAVVNLIVDRKKLYE